MFLKSKFYNTIAAASRHHGHDGYAAKIITANRTIPATNPGLAEWSWAEVRTGVTTGLSPLSGISSVTEDVLSTVSVAEGLNVSLVDLPTGLTMGEIDGLCVNVVV